MMQSIKSLLKLAMVVFPAVATAQSSYIMPGSKDEILLDRLEIKSRLDGLNVSYIKPYNSKLVTEQVVLADSLDKAQNRISTRLTPVDRYNISRFLQNHFEWVPNNDSKGKRFNLVEINKPNFFLVVNPALNYQQGFESFDDQSIFLRSAGISSRGMIGKRLGFSLYLTGNQEATPYYVRQFTQQFHAVPGNTLLSYKDKYVQYFDVRASLQWKVTRFMDMQFGHDRNFLGNGERSLLLSGFSGNMMFFKINTRLWKFNFENLYMKLIPQFGIVNNQANKYLRVNTLSFNAAKWLNIGIFDAVAFGREKQFELTYLQPFTFLRALEQQNGSPDNALLGLNVKANIKGNVQVYGQLLLDEFKLSEIKDNKGWWANKYGFQLGAKYIDAFNIKNLDVQAEINRTRPFTYTHYDSVSNYSNANQPLAHQLGAGFQEYLAIVRYQPLNKLYLQAKFMYYYQGLDSAGQHMGSNILTDYRNRAKDANGQIRNYGWNIGSGDKATCVYFNANASYEVWENLFLDAGFTLRNFKTELGYKQNTTMFNIGFRWNMARREFDF
jgi:hypothetical protein